MAIPPAEQSIGTSGVQKQTNAITVICETPPAQEDEPTCEQQTSPIRRVWKIIFLIIKFIVLVIGIPMIYRKYNEYKNRDEIDLDDKLEELSVTTEYSF